MARRHPVHPRHRERVLVFQGLFMMDVGGLTVDEALTALKDLADAGPAAASSLVEQELRALHQRLPEIDALIEKNTENWRFERLARVERNVLRLGTFELLQGQEPFQIIISEAIDLAKKFGDERSGSFVNGVLDAVWRTVAPPGETSQE